MRDKKGYTLIEAVVSLLIFSIMIATLAGALSGTFRTLQESETYKKNSDNAFDGIQDNSTKKEVSVDYVMTIPGVDDDIPIKFETYPTNNEKNKTGGLQLSTFTDKLETATGYVFNYKQVKPKPKSNGEPDFDIIEGLENHPISQFSDLPNMKDSEAFASLESLDKFWGSWSFVGWSTKEYKYEDRSVNGALKYYYCGDPNIATQGNNYEGLITKDNFNDVLDYYKSTGKEPNLYATYIYSQDVDENQAEMNLLTRASSSTRLTRDQKTLSDLAFEAAKLIKNDNNIINKSFSNSQDVYSNGIEILHFRENSWAVLANNGYEVGAKGGTSDYEKSAYYKDFPKIGNNFNYTGGIKNGFLYDVFHDGIQFDLSKVGDINKHGEKWLGIEYNHATPVRTVSDEHFYDDYGALFFGDNMITDVIEQTKNGKTTWVSKASAQKTHPKSLFMRVNKANKTVTFFVGTINQYGDVIADAGYEASASYA